ncbi:hypothetical protein MCOR16_004593, partial [Pyricularia oryzae]
ASGPPCHHNPERSSDLRDNLRRRGLQIGLLVHGHLGEHDNLRVRRYHHHLSLDKHQRNHDDDHQRHCDNCKHRGRRPHPHCL